MTRARRAVTAAVLAGVVLGSCKLDDFVTGENPGPEGPVAGTLFVAVSTPNTDDGAVRLTLTGPRVTTPRAASSAYLLFSGQPSPQELDIAVFGDIVSENLVAMPILDVATVGAYTATITQVATDSDSLRTDLSGYGTTITVVSD